MRTPPPDLTEDAVAATVADHWSITATSADYAPVGFGSHHWILTAPSRRWFVTADAVADDTKSLTELTAALSTAHALRHRCGLDFVVAPCPGRDNSLLVIIGRYAVALYPYLEHSTDASADPQQMLTMITALHAATAHVADLVTVDDLTIPHRPALEAILAAVEPNSSCGPFAADFAALIRAHEQPLRAALSRHDASASTLGANKADWVVTHGEPKPNNTMITAAGPVLVDWDTVQLAPAARDLWMSGASSAYTSLTGLNVTAEQLDFYRRRWDLKDLCVSAGWFTALHERTTDTELAWQGSIKICDRLAHDTRVTESVPHNGRVLELTDQQIGSRLAGAGRTEDVVDHARSGWWRAPRRRR